MNWKAEAVRRLKSHEALRQAVLSIPVELRLLENQILDTRQERTDLFDRMRKRRELLRNLEQTHQYIRGTEQALTILNEEERQLLERLYIRPVWGNVNRLSLDTGMARSTLYRKKEEALARFAQALYGCNWSLE